MELTEWYGTVFQACLRNEAQHCVFADGSVPFYRGIMSMLHATVGSAELTLCRESYVLSSHEHVAPEHTHVQHAICCIL